MSGPVSPTLTVLRLIVAIADVLDFYSDTESDTEIASANHSCFSERLGNAMVSSTTRWHTRGYQWQKQR